MSDIRLLLADTEATEQLGKQLAAEVEAPALILLRGDLGAGKTTFSRGFIQALGHRGPVKSPTYTLIEPYELPAARVFHLDLYRLNDPGELEFLGLPDLIAQGGVCLIEWPERAEGGLPQADLTIHLHHVDGARHAELIAHSPRALGWLKASLAHFQSISHLKD